MSAAFDLTSRFAKGLPDPSPRFGGFPKYNFVGGHNDPERIPIEGLIEATASVLRREGSKLAMYNLGQGPQGFIGLREFVADKLNRHRGMNIGRDEVLITTGSGQGIEMISRMFVEPGDTVILEEFCYAGAINRFKRVGANIIGIPLDEDGMRMDVLASTLEGLKQKGVTPKYIYTIPTIKNPSGSILPLERRQQMLALARQYGVPIFEDECYADLIWSGGAPPSLYSMDPKQVVHIGSFSKTLAPALRVGYAVAEWPVLSRMMACKTDSGTGALDQMIVAEYFSKFFDKHVGALSGVLKEKLDTMVEGVSSLYSSTRERCAVWLSKCFGQYSATIIWSSAPCLRRSCRQSFATAPELDERIANAQRRRERLGEGAYMHNLHGINRIERRRRRMPLDQVGVAFILEDRHAVLPPRRQAVVAGAPAS